MGIRTDTGVTTYHVWYVLNVYLWNTTLNELHELISCYTLSVLWGKNYYVCSVHNETDNWTLKSICKSYGCQVEEPRLKQRVAYL